MKYFVLFFILLLNLTLRAENQFLALPGEIIKTENGKSYSVESYLGKGGFGSVFKVKTLNEKSQTRALKAIIVDRTDPSENEIVFSNYLKAHQFAKAIAEDSEDFVKIFNIEKLDVENKDTESTLLIEMEYIEGHDLSQHPTPLLVKTEASNTQLEKQINRLEQLVDFGIRVIQQLAQYFIVHADINPKNIIYTKEGSFKLLDYENIHFPGACNYGCYLIHSSKEVVSGNAMVGASDLYSLGSTLGYFLLGESVAEIYLKNVSSHFKDAEGNPTVDIYDIINTEFFHSGMLGHIKEKLHKKSLLILNPLLRERFMRLADLALKLMAYQPEERNFEWKGKSYDYQMMTLPTCDSALAGT